MGNALTRIERPMNPDLDYILGLPFGVHDHGFVRLIDYMGGDASIVQAARVSYGAGTKTRNDDRGLIRYLLRHDHTTPFEMCEIKLHLKMPIFVARQWVRHRTASMNEVSGRYSVMPEEFYVPEPGAVQAQSTANKQGRGDSLPGHIVEWFRNVVSNEGKRAFGAYKTAVEEPMGISRELARINLPLGTYTEFYWKVDLHNLFRFLRLRTDPHAQKEIRDYANVVSIIVEKWCPVAFEAWLDYQRNAVTLSAPERAIVRAMLANLTTETRNLMIENSGLSRREQDELREKLMVPRADS
jgi:thymidylate synthase (FAD)